MAFGYGRISVNKERFFNKGGVSVISKASCSATAAGELLDFATSESSSEYTNWLRGQSPELLKELVFDSGSLFKSIYILPYEPNFESLSQDD